MGVVLESPAQILKYTVQIHQQVATRAMPIGNLTAMTEQERAELLAWIQHGAPR
jgi:uncharacterized membrane protein